MSDTFEQTSTLQYDSYNDIAKPVLKDGLLINNPNPRVENADEKKVSMDAVKEGYTGYTNEQGLLNVYNAIAPYKGVYSDKESDNVIQRKYEMDTEITYPPNHPNYKPTTREIIMNDTAQQMDQQYNTLVMMVAATASLGIIAFMLTSNTPSAGP
jgi:hypothetical protein